LATLSRLAAVPVSEIRSLGPKRAAVLARAGILSVADLLHHVPRAYLDRSDKPPLARVPLGTEVTIIAEVKAIATRRPKPKLTMTEALIADESASLKVVWFNQQYREKLLQPGTEAAFSGTVESFRGKLQMSNPAVEVLDGEIEPLVTGRIVPIYSQVGEVKTGNFLRAMHNALNRARPIPDPIPEVLLAMNGLMSREDAYSLIHFPDTESHTGPARDRLVYDELLRLEVSLALQKRRQMDEATGFAHLPTGELVDRFIAGLPYQLTGDQKKVLTDIDRDLRAAHPMHRLLQGEVGSGKTVVAVATLLNGVEGGWQGAIMAPTEVLAVQHYLGVTGLLAEAGLSPEPFAVSSELGMESLFGTEGPAVHIGILTGSTASTNYRPEITRQALLEDVASGQVDILVGTHALIQEGVRFRKLGLAVVDEQHRFGVAQRVLLKEKAETIEPDQ